MGSYLQVEKDRYRRFGKLVLGISYASVPNLCRSLKTETIFIFVEPCISGTERGNRTPMMSPSRDFESDEMRKQAQSETN